MKLEDYSVGWICALPVEFAASIGMLDERHDALPLPASDKNNYALGKIGDHNVVMSCLPAAGTGIASAARLVERMQSTFPKLRFGLMVGVGGGVPTDENDIRLGDIVVSMPTGTDTGVIQYDFGKTVQEGKFVRTGSLNRPPRALLNAVGYLQSKHMLQGSDVLHHMCNMIQKYPNMRASSAYPGIECDVFYEADYDHPGKPSTCARCDASKIIDREERTDTSPSIWYGLIASGSQVMRDGKTRDKLQAQLNVLCFEMEAAGLMDDFPCLVIRGICDYADSHKNKKWQPYAAATAAAYAKELLCVITTVQVDQTKTVAEEMSMATNPPATTPLPRPNDQPAASVTTVAHRQPLPPPSVSRPNGMAVANVAQPGRRPDLQSRLIERLHMYVPDAVNDMIVEAYVKSYYHYRYIHSFNLKARERHPETCKWLDNHDTFRWWCLNPTRCLLWYTGEAGTGKSVLSTYLVSKMYHGAFADLRLGTDSTVLYSFGEENTNSTGSSLLSVAIHQLLVRYSSLKHYAYENDDLVARGAFKADFHKAKTQPVSKVWATFCQLINQSGLKRVYFVVDGLDDCEESAQRELIRLFASAPDNLSIWISSRPTKTLFEALEEWPTGSTPDVKRLESEAELQKEINEDMDTYCVAQVKKIAPSRGFSLAQQEQIFQHLRNNAAATFLSLRLILEKLATTPAVNLSCFLRETPTDLPSLYQRLCDQIPKDTNAQLWEPLKYLFYAYGPLRVGELGFACRPQSVLTGRPLHFQRTTATQDEEYLAGFRYSLHRYEPLIHVRQQDGVIEFVHPSAKEFMMEYFRNSSGPAAAFVLHPRQAQQDIAKACLRLLVNKVDLPYPSSYEDAKDYATKMADLLAKNTLLDYALQFWYRHLREATESVRVANEVNAELLSLMQSLAKNWRSPERENFRRIMVQCSGLHFVGEKHGLSTFEFFSALGLSAFILAILHQARPDSLGYPVKDEIESAIMLAIEGGHETTLLTIMKQLDISSLDGKAYYGILQTAAWGQKPELVRMLLSLRKRDPSEMAEAARAAFATGSRETLEALVEETSAFEDRDLWGMTVLHRLCFKQWNAVPGRRDEATEQLAEAAFLVTNQKVNIRQADRIGNTALHYAAWNRYPTEFLRGLVQLGADPLATNRFRWIALHLAARYADSTSTIEFLLEVGGADTISFATWGGNTPLHWATQRHRSMDYDEEVVRLLLLHGADPRIPNRRGETPLTMAGCSHYGVAVFQGVYGRLDGVQHIGMRPALLLDYDEDEPMDDQEWERALHNGGQGDVERELGPRDGRLRRRMSVS